MARAAPFGFPPRGLRSAGGGADRGALGRRAPPRAAGGARASGNAGRGGRAAAGDVGPGDRPSRCARTCPGDARGGRVRDLAPGPCGRQVVAAGELRAVARVPLRCAGSDRGQSECGLVRGADRGERHRRDQLADERAQGSACGRGHARPPRHAAASLGRGDRDARVLLAPPADLRRGRAAAGQGRGEPRRRRARDGCGLRGAGAAGGEPPGDLRGERATRLLARLRDDPLERRGARRAGTGRLVRGRHRRRRRLDSAPRGRALGSGEDRARQGADREAADRSRRAEGRTRSDPNAATGGDAGDLRRGPRGAVRRSPRPARGAAQPRSPEFDDGSARGAQARGRRDHIRRRGVETPLRRRRPLDRDRSGAARGDRRRQCAAVPRGAGQGKPGPLLNRPRVHCARVRP